MSQGNEIHRIRVLVAEDDSFSGKMMETVLKSRNFDVTVVENGLMVLEHLKKEKVDIILMDIHMPEQDGLITTKLIREMESPVKNIPIIALTAFAMKGDQETCIAAGMNDYISKPLNIEELMVKIDAFFSGKKTISKNRSSENITDPETDIAGEISLGIQAFIKENEDDPEFLKEVLSTYPGEMKKRMRRLEKALLKSDYEEIGLAAHKLSILFSVIQANPAKEISLRIEKAARSSNQKENCADDFTRLKEKTGIILNQLEKVSSLPQIDSGSPEK